VSGRKGAGTVIGGNGNNAGAGLIPNIGQIPDINQIIANQQGRKLLASAVEECGNQLSKDWCVWEGRMGREGVQAATTRHW
jgi:hypothetical protein